MRAVTPLLASTLFASAVCAQSSDDDRGRFYIAVGVGGSAFTDVLPTQPAVRPAFAITGTFGVRLSPRIALQSDVVMASPRVQDLFMVLAATASDAPNTNVASPLDRERSRTMVAIAPAIEVQPFAGYGMRMRVGPAFLATEAQRGPRITTTTTNANLVQASGFGWRAGVSAPVGHRGSPIMLHADVMRANTANGVVLLVPVGMSVRIW